MITQSQQPAIPHYRCTVIATCDTATYAQAVLSALNFQRVMVTARTLILADAPEEVGLN